MPRQPHIALAALLATSAIAGCSRSPAPLVRIVARDYAYDMPARVPAGLINLRLVNEGPDVHEALVVRFSPSGGTASAYVDSVRADVDFPAFAIDIGGAGLARASDSSEVWLELDPGRYAIVCWKGDHLQRGMARDFEVVSSGGNSASAPKADVEVELSEYAYHSTGALTAGRHIIHVRNTGHQAHEIDIYRLPAGRTVQEYMDWSGTGEKGEPPAIPVGGVGDLSPGREVWMPILLSPGKYFMICQIKDSGDGTPHYRRGMFNQFEVR